MKDYSVYSLPHKVRVLKALIRDHFDSWQPEVSGLISPRNYLYYFERLWNIKFHRKGGRSNRGVKYTEYRIPDVVTMEKAIALFKKYGGELTLQEEVSAIKRTKQLVLSIHNNPKNNRGLK